MSFGVPSPDLVTLEATVRAYSARPRAEDPLDLATALIRLRIAINALELTFARDAAQFAGGYDEDLLGDPSPYAWMRENCHMSAYAAVSAVHVGDTAATLQRSRAALLEGRIGFAHLCAMATTAQAIETSATATSRFDETRLLAKAEDLSLKRFRLECAHVRHAADREAFLAEQVNDHDWRVLKMRPYGDGGLELHGFLDGEGGAVVRTALEPLAEKRGSDDDRPRDTRCADALVELCSHSLDTGLVPQRASQRSHVQVTTTLETLLDQVGAPGAEMEYAGVIAGTTVQRLACDATITRVLVNAQSAVVDLGRSERVVPGATRRALNVRDKGCRWPGCDRTASWTAAHHVIHWAHGGATDLDNLVLLCGYHHWSVHEGGWRIALSDHGTLVTSPPQAEARSPDLHWVQ
jgi:Domain of unknown function (DUF222)/HNH endonuclease